LILDKYDCNSGYDNILDILEDLLKAGADPNLCIKAENKFNLSPLLLSALHGNLEFMRLFLKYNADVNFYDIYRLTEPALFKMDVLIAVLMKKQFMNGNNNFYELYIRLLLHYY
jgi:ankyrin repeat protein